MADQQDLFGVVSFTTSLAGQLDRSVRQGVCIVYRATTSGNCMIRK